MVFYLITPGQSGNTITDHNILGEISFKSFHIGIAYGTLLKLIKSNNIKALSKVIIIDSNNKKWELESFLEYLEDYHFIQY